MSYEAWRREVANGTMADWDEERQDYADAPSRGASDRLCCINRLANNPPTVPHQRCSNGHQLPWYDANDPERGWFDSDDETGGQE